MLGLVVKLGRFKMAEARSIRRVVVFCSIHQAGFQRGKHFANGHGRGVGPHGAGQGHPQVGLLHADLHALGVGHGTHRFFAVNGPGAGIVISQQDEALRFAVFGNFVANRAVQHLVQVVHRAEQERQGRDVGLGADGIHRADVDAGHVQRPNLDLVNGFFLRPQGTFVEHFDAVFAAAGLLELVAHELDRRDGGIVFAVVYVGRFEFCGQGQAGQQRCCHSDQGFF